MKEETKEKLGMLSVILSITGYVAFMCWGFSDNRWVVNISIGIGLYLLLELIYITIIKTAKEKVSYTAFIGANIFIVLLAMANNFFISPLILNFKVIFNSIIGFIMFNINSIISLFYTQYKIIIIIACVFILKYTIWKIFKLGK